MSKPTSGKSLIYNTGPNIDLCGTLFECLKEFDLSLTLIVCNYNIHDSGNGFDLGNVASLTA